MGTPAGGISSYIFDLAWLHPLLAEAHAAVSDPGDYDAWVEYIRTSNNWSEQLRRATQVRVAQRKLDFQVQSWSLSFRSSLGKAGVHVSDQEFRATSALLCEPFVGSFAPIGGESASTLPPVQCPECGQMFADGRGLGAHRFNKHQVTCVARRFSPSTVCNACLIDFHFRPRLIIHLQHKKRVCLSRLQHSFPPLSEEETQQLDSIDAAHLRTVRSAGSRLPIHRLPCTRYVGPVLWPSSEEHAAQPAVVVPLPPSLLFRLWQ